MILTFKLVMFAYSFYVSLSMHRYRSRNTEIRLTHVIRCPKFLKKIKEKSSLVFPELKPVKKLPMGGMLIEQRS